VSCFLESNGIPVTGSNPAQITIERDVTVGSLPDEYTRVSVDYQYKVMTMNSFLPLAWNLPE